MSNGIVRWIALGLLLMLVLSVIGLIAYARGPKHHHGDDVGTHGTQPALVSSS